MNPTFTSASAQRNPAANRLSARVRQPGAEPVPTSFAGDCSASNPDYIEWLTQRSMLHDGQVLARQVSGQAAMWQRPFALADPKRAVATSSVWFTAYPASLITPEGTSFAAAMGDEALWRAFAQIGITGMHAGPTKWGGGLLNGQPTPSVDGHFDRMSTLIDPMFGTEDEFRDMCRIADEFGATIIDDVIPGHTGKGADFRLAEMAVGEYPGVFHMIDIPAQFWHLLPEVPTGTDAVNLNLEQEAALKEAGLIIGELFRVIFYEPGVKETNWSATGEIVGVDGVTRRWVYLHYFKQGQPTLNWMDPTAGGMRLVYGDVLHSLLDLGAKGLRLDANGFLALERTGDDTPAWSQGHPDSHAANQLLAAMIRKSGGFSFQELNLCIEDLAETMSGGADLSYDFVNRPSYHHALVTGDVTFVQLTLQAAFEQGVQPVSLVHALQNHDELTTELVHFHSKHAHTVFDYAGEQLTGRQIVDKIRGDLSRPVIDAVDYNRRFSQNGIACTTASVITAALGMEVDVDAPAAGLDAAQIATVRQLHLLGAMFNALQPGVFALSGWDLVGAMTVGAGALGELLDDGDTRWMNRGAYDLMGACPDAKSSQSGLPRAASLYGDLPSQLADPESFCSQLGRVLSVREALGLAQGEALGLAASDARSVLGMVHELPDGRVQCTVLNFGAEPVEAVLRHEAFAEGAAFADALASATGGAADSGAVADGVVCVQLAGRSGQCLVLG